MTYKGVPEFLAHHPFGSITIKRESDFDLPWVARPFIAGPSNYETLEECRAAVEAYYEARILSALASDAPPAPTSGSEDGGEAVDPRPLNCRFRLFDEGKPYPKSSCSACGKGIASGLGKRCTVGLATIDHTLAKPSSEPAGGVREALAELLADYTSPNPNRDKGAVWGMIARAEAALSSSAGPAVEPVGIVGSMPGTDGFTMAAFKAEDAPVGTKLYAHPAPATVEMREVTTAMVDAAWNEGKKRRMTGRPNDFRAILEAALAPATEGRKG